MPTHRSQPWTGPAILSYGFRPFFFLGSLYAGVSVMLWLPVFYGELELSTLFAPSDWHVHELFYGYLSAILTGFLFTAVPNWTGRMPIRGYPLLVLVLVWFAGRIAIGFSSHIGWAPAMAIDLAFLASIGGVIAREIIKGQNWKNLKVVIPLFVLLVANGLFHLEAHFYGISDISQRLAMAAIITLIMLIGGRIIPSFTRNWLVRENPGQLPTPFNTVDKASLLVAIPTLLSWVAAPQSMVTAVLALLAAIAQFIRLSRWAGFRTLRDPLVIILHISYAFIPVGFLLLALSILVPDAVSSLAPMHAWGAGAAGSMTMSVMVRASFGHSGRPLKSTMVTNLIFVSLLSAAIARITAAIVDGHTDLLLHIAAFGWFFAFAGFALFHIPLFFKAKRKA
ncbi:MAG: short-chain dehydrogenase [Hyphomicrobiales bacterium]|nr:MAG: short-chain dehydrogenase [Hyphomicrobiales bacterium]